MEDDERVEVAEDFRNMSSLDCEVKLELDNKCDSNIGVILTIDKKHIVKEEGIPSTLTGIADHPKLIDCVKQEHASDSGDGSDNEERKEALSLSCIAGTSSGACEDVDKPELVDYIKLEKLEHDSDNSDSFEDNMVSEDHDSKTIIEHSLEEIKDESSAESCVSADTEIDASGVDKSTDMKEYVDSKTYSDTDSVATLEQQTNGQSALLRHIANIHSNEMNYQCDFCDYRATSESFVTKHVEKVHLRRQFKCHSCNYKSSNRGNVRNHMKSVHMRMRKFKCNCCDFKSYKYSNIKRHVDSFHNLGAQLYACDSCNFTTHNLAGLKQHVDASHCDLKKYDCHMCNYKTIKNRGLKAHIRRMHKDHDNAETESHICFLCGYSTNSKRNLKIHKDTAHLQTNITN